VIARIVHETPDVLVVDKPAGVPTIPDRFGAAGLIDQLAAERGERLWVVHRLDREVTGLLLVARTAAAHRQLSMWLEDREVRKTYAALTTGEPPGPAGTTLRWADRLLRGKRRAYAAPHGKEAVTDAVFERVSGGVLTWTLRPRTGRNHQLRVHLASRGWPILGDALYGSAEVWPVGIALRAIRVELPDRTVWEVPAEWPVDPVAGR
jgi:23S rRNA-/tRNA-specific pseudouridylate synthase